MSWNSAAVLVAAWMAAGGAVAGAIVGWGGCIPDLPSATPAAAPAAFCGDSVIELDAGETCDPGPHALDAGMGLCSADCRMQCPAGLLWTNNHCYQMPQNALLPQNIAGFQPDLSFLRQACQAGHLVTFSAEDEFQAVASYFDASPFWVGLETAPVSPATIATTGSRYLSVASYEPGWQPMCRGCYAHTSDPNAPLPATLDGSADGAPEDCVVALSDPDAAWHQYPCSTISQLRQFLRTPPPGVICEVEPLGVQSLTCEAGICIDLVKTYGAKRYVYGATPLSATDAQKACSTLGGRLVVLQSADEREQLWRELFRSPLAPSGAWGVWIGLSQVPSANRFAPPTWSWDDGTPENGAYPSQWGAGQPTGFGGTTRAFLWHATPQAPDDTLAHNDHQPNTLLPYVCEINVGARDAGTE